MLARGRDCDGVRCTGCYDTVYLAEGYVGADAWCVETVWCSETAGTTVDG